MRNFLEEALEQEQEETRQEGSLPLDADAKKALEGRAVWKKGEGPDAGRKDSGQGRLSVQGEEGSSSLGEEETGGSLFWKRVPPGPGGKETGGAILDGKNGPPGPPQEPPEGESFDSLPLWTPPLTDQRGAIAMAPLWKHPRAVLSQVGKPRPLAPQRGRGTEQRGDGDPAPYGGDSLPLLSAVRRGESAAAFAQGTRRKLTVTLPETESAGGLTAEELDRAVERDARRYAGSAPLD